MMPSIWLTCCELRDLSDPSPTLNVAQEETQRKILVVARQPFVDGCPRRFTSRLQTDCGNHEGVLMAARAEPKACPACGSADVARIMYGFPTSEAFDDPTIVLGGCVVWPDSPAFACRGCEHEWGRR